MNLHEFQGKALFAKYDLPVSNGKVIYEAEDALKACRDVGGSKWVVKAQVHAGGRGKSGGVKLVDSPEPATAPTTPHTLASWRPTFPTAAMPTGLPPSSPT